MTGEERIYELLLRLYPEEFRVDYAHEMRLAFRDLRADREGIAQFWWRILWDTVRSAPALTIQTSRARFGRGTHNPGGIMKAMSILAVIVGVFTIVNASVEGWSGGLVNHDAQSLVVWLVGALAGLSLLAAGVMLLARSSAAITRAQAAAAICIAGFVLMLLIGPRLSILANLLGIAFPLVLIAYVQLNRGKGRSTPLMS